MIIASIFFPLVLITIVNLINLYNKNLQTYYDLVFPQKNWVMIIGSINGLICYAAPWYDSNGGRRIYIWNPTIRKLKILPKSRLYLYKSVCGFWFDANANDYRVAKINYKGRCKVEVYNLSTNSWELIATGGPGLGVCPGEDMIHVNGTLHWLISCTEDWRNRSWMIISFNISSGIFKETLIWQEERVECRFVLLKTESLDRSFLIVQHESVWLSIPTCCRVYDEGVNELYMIDLGERNLSRAIGVRNNNSNEVLFLEDNGRQGSRLLVCDVQDFSDIEAFKLTDFRYLDIDVNIRRIRPFAETLVLFND